MFKLINTLVLILFLIPQVSNTILWVNYELNKQAITEEFCVNIEKPELKCEGQCHLAEQLSETSPSPESNQPAEVNYLPEIPLFYQEIPEVNLSVDEDNLLNDHSLHFYRYSPVFEIDNPPRFV